MMPSIPICPLVPSPQIRWILRELVSEKKKRRERHRQYEKPQGRSLKPRGLYSPNSTLRRDVAHLCPVLSVRGRGICLTEAI